MIFPIVKSNIFAIFRIQRFWWIKNPVPCSMWRYGIFFAFAIKKTNQVVGKTNVWNEKFGIFARNIFPDFPKIFLPEFWHRTIFDGLKNLEILSAFKRRNFIRKNFAQNLRVFFHSTNVLERKRRNLNDFLWIMHIFEGFLEFFYQNFLSKIRVRAQ